MGKGPLPFKRNTGIRIFPALNIDEQELEEGLGIIEQVVAAIPVSL